MARAPQEGYTAGQVALLKSDLPLANKIRFYGTDVKDVFDVAPDGSAAPGQPLEGSASKEKKGKGKGKGKGKKDNAGDAAPKSAAA